MCYIFVIVADVVRWRQHGLGDEDLLFQFVLYVQSMQRGIMSLEPLS